MIRVKEEGEGAEYERLLFESITRFKPVWMSVVLFQSAMIWIVCPLMVFYYESNDKLRVYERIKRAIKIQLPRFVFILLFGIITAFLSRESHVPFEFGQRTYNREYRVITRPGTDEKFMVI